MRKYGIAALMGLALVAAACQKKAEETPAPADTATVAPAPAPAPAPMDSAAAAMDTTVKDTAAKK